MPEIRASVDQQVKTGEFYGPSGLLELSGHPTLVKPKQTACDTVTASKLWVTSEQLTSVRFH